MTAQIGRQSRLLRPLSEQQLRQHVEAVQADLLRERNRAAEHVLVPGMAAAAEALRRVFGVELYDVQLIAAIELAGGRIAQMQTGEGKTFVAIAAACYLAMCGRGVHVATPNSYLALRDFQQACAAAGALGLSTGLLTEQGDPEDKRRAYDCDITYGTGSEFGFDYLRDQLTLRQLSAAPLGDNTMHRLSALGLQTRETMQRGLNFAIVDEADSVMIDDACSPLVLSMSSSQEAADRDVHLAACHLSDQLLPETDFCLNDASGRLVLTETGLKRCYDDAVHIPEHQLLRPWTEYVEQALRARYLFKRDIHFVLTDNKVRIVDETTGRIFDDRSWQNGLHQAIEAREGLPITAENQSVAQITRQRFFRLYHNLCGMTGTTAGCEKEFAFVYNCPVTEIPLYRPSLRIVLPTRFFATVDGKHAAIVKSAVEISSGGRPVLIGTRSISDSEQLAYRLAAKGLRCQLLNGTQTEEEAAIVAEAGQQSSITIATNLAGRGTDISLGPGVEALGGLHVIVAECQLSSRMDRQLVGRCARQGDPGTAQMFVSADDTLLVRFGEWLAAAIRRDCAAGGEASHDFTAQLCRVQTVAERQYSLVRREILRQDKSRDTLFGNA